MHNDRNDNNKIECGGFWRMQVGDGKLNNGLMARSESFH